MEVLIQEVWSRIKILPHDERRHVVQALTHLQEASSELDDDLVSASGTGTDKLAPCVPEEKRGVPEAHHATDDDRSVVPGGDRNEEVTASGASKNVHAIDEQAGYDTGTGTSTNIEEGVADGNAKSGQGEKIMKIHTVDNSFDAEIIQYSLPSYEPVMPPDTQLGKMSVAFSFRISEMITRHYWQLSKACIKSQNSIVENNFAEPPSFTAALAAMLPFCGSGSVTVFEHQFFSGSSFSKFSASGFIP